MAPKQNISKPVSASVVLTAAKKKRSNGDSYGTNRADTKRRKGDDGSRIALDNASDKSLQGVKRPMAMDDNSNTPSLSPAVPAKKTKSASSPTSIIKVAADDKFAVLRNLFSLQPTYRKTKLCQDSNLSPYTVNKFLSEHCEKINPCDRNSEWRMMKQRSSTDNKAQQLDNKAQFQLPLLLIRSRLIVQICLLRLCVQL